VCVVAAWDEHMRASREADRMRKRMEERILGHALLDDDQMARLI